MVPGDDVVGDDDVALGAPPWRLRGEAVAALVRPPAALLDRLPDGVDAVPGPALVLAVRWERTPMGPYRELTVAVPARTGTRPGWSVVLMVVDSAGSCRAGRRNWGLPKELGRLAWRPADEPWGLRWDDGSLQVSTGRRLPGPVAVPVVLPIPLLQRRDDGLVTVPGRVRARVRPALVEVEVADEGPLGPLAGRHAGATLSDLRLWLGPARAR